MVNCFSSKVSIPSFPFTYPCVCHVCVRVSVCICVREFTMSLKITDTVSVSLGSS